MALLAVYYSYMKIYLLKVPFYDDKNFIYNDSDGLWLAFSTYASWSPCA